jgi:hypothetical protein
VHDTHKPALPQNRLAGTREAHNFTTLNELARNQSASVRFLPHGKPWTRGMPSFDHLLASFVGFPPLHHVEEKGFPRSVDNCVGVHGLSHLRH